MRRVLVLLFLVGLGFANVAAAQSRGHDIGVSIPNILRLKIDDKVAQDRANVDIDIRVSNGAFEIAPAGSNVQVMANSAWQLSASYVPASEADAAAQLMWRAEANEGGWERFTSYPQIVERGENTGGWQNLELRYGLQSLPADGHYQGTVTYTVTRP